MTRKFVAWWVPFRRLVGTWWTRRRTLFEGLTFRLWRLEATVSDMDQVPPNIRPRRAYLVATPSRRKWLAFDCACSSGHRILLNLDASRRPVWTLRLSRTKALTLHPSVNYHDDHRTCHYILSNGRIEWVAPPSHINKEVAQWLTKTQRP